MPWCPQCDEIFPEGPACPRCRTPLVDVSGTPQADEMQGQIALPQLKVPRRIRRAFGSTGQPPAPSRQLVAFALSLVLIAGGFALGRMSAVPPDAPLVRSAPAPELELRRDGFVDFVARVPSAAGEFDLALVRISLTDGRSNIAERFPSPFRRTSAGRELSSLVAVGESIAVVMTDREQSMVGAFPSSQHPLLWLDGTEAAWEGPGVLLVRRETSVKRWVFGPEGVSSSEVPGSWVHVLQAPDTAVLEGTDGGQHFLSLSTPDGPRRVLDVPEDGKTVAVGRQGSRALFDSEDGLRLWDGDRLHPASPLTHRYDVHGASFSADGERVAVTLRERRDDGKAPLLLAVLEASGERVELTRPLTQWSGDRACSAVPAWDGSRSWVFVGLNDGSIYATEVGGGREIRTKHVQNVGCGVAWSS